MNIIKLLNSQSNAIASGQKILVLLFALSGLAACGGGASTESTPNNNSQTQGNTYTGIITSELHRGFALEVWPKLVPADRCGSCHVTGGQGTGAFVDNNIVTAFNAAVPRLINTSSPSQSLLVSRVAAGHNCWLADNNDCAVAMTRYIENMVNGTSTSGGGTSITLVAPVSPNAIPGGGLVYPADSSDFKTYVYDVVLRNNCQTCHKENASPQTPQSPFFASDDISSAYAGAKTKMNLDNPVASRLVQRMVTGHNCFKDPAATPPSQVDCVYSKTFMQSAIQNYADAIRSANPPVPVPVAGTGVSYAMKLSDGQPASGGNRADGNVIAMWQFKEGPTNNVTVDQFNSIALTLSGVEGTDYNWLAGYGIQLVNSSAQTTGIADAAILRTLIGSSNEYSIEAWVIPDNVADNNVMIVNYGADRSDLNFALGQSMYNYDYLQADTNAVTAVSTPDADEEVATTLQHVVATYDSQNGRRIYVNGQLTAAPSGTAGNILGWSDKLFRLGGGVGGGSQWKGSIRLVAIHDRALQQQQIVQNYEAGVGEKLFIMFNVSGVIGGTCLVSGPQCYIYFEVSQFDPYSYLFNKPTFISLDGNTPQAALIPLRGMRIGINGKLASTGQAYANLNLDIDASKYIANVGQVLSTVGTIIPLEKGADDEFYLAFEDLNNTGTAFIEAVPQAPTLSNPTAVPGIGVRMFDEINQTMAQLTGVDPNLPSIGGTVANNGADGVFTTYRQQLPSTSNIQAFLASHQMAISQIAMTYCDELVKDTAKRSAYFPAFNFNRTPSDLVLPVPGFPTDLVAAGNPPVIAIRNEFIEPLLKKMLNVDLADSTNNLTVQPMENNIRVELNDFVTRMTACVSTCNNTARTAEIVTATCAVALGNASMLVQ